MKRTSKPEARSKSRAGRSIPQHVRGLDIRPSQDSNILHDLHPATSQNIQRPASSGSESSASGEDAAQTTKQRKAAFVEIADESKSLQDGESDEETDEIVVANPIGRRGPQGQSKNKQADSSRLAKPKSSTQQNPIVTSRSNKKPRQPRIAPATTPTDPESQKARQKAALARGEEAMAQNPEFAEIFMKEEDPEMKQKLLQGFIQDFRLDPILLSMFSAGEQKRVEVQEEVDGDFTSDEDETESLPSDTELEDAGIIPETQPSPQGRTRRLEQTQQQQSSDEVRGADEGVEDEPERITGAAASRQPQVVSSKPESEQDASRTPQETTSASRQRRNHIPTPPMSLDQVDTSVDEDDVEPVPLVDATESQVEPGKKKQKKPSQRKKAVARESAEKIEDNDDDQYAALEVKFEDDISEAECKPEKKSRKQKSLRGTIKGTWTTEEIAVADEIFDSICREFRCTGYELCHEMNDWGGVYPEFKQKIYEAFPLRSKKAIRSFCQRRWHDNNTGPWTEEEDEELRKWYAVYPNDWVEIALEIPGGRTAASCRDRWIGCLRYQGKLKAGPWTKAEEEKLVSLVQAHSEEKAHEGRRTDWNRISEGMGRTRSAKRCQVKWKAIQKRQTPVNEDLPEKIDDEEDEDTMLQHSIMAQMQPNDGQQKSKKQRELDRAYAKLGWGDVVDALKEIFLSFPKPEYDKEFGHESTFWSIVGTRVSKRDNESVFKSHSKLRRRCYYGALAVFGDEQVEKRKGPVRKTIVLLQNMFAAKDRGEITFERLFGMKPREVLRKRPRGASITEAWLEGLEPPGSSPPPYLQFDDDGEIVIPETQEVDAVAGAP